MQDTNWAAVRERFELGAKETFGAVKTGVQTGVEEGEKAVEGVARKREG
jgi:hypothetical protein